MRFIILLISCQLFKSTGEEYWCRMYRMWGSEHGTSWPAFWLLNGNSDFSPTIFDSLCWKTKSVLYYIYHMQAGGKMLLLKLFFSSFCIGYLLPLFGKGQEDRGKGAQAISLCTISSFMTWWSIWTTGIMVATVKYWVCDILFPFAMPTGWFYCYMHAIFLWFTFKQELEVNVCHLLQAVYKALAFNLFSF